MFDFIFNTPTVLWTFIEQVLFTGLLLAIGLAGWLVYVLIYFIVIKFKKEQK